MLALTRAMAADYLREGIRVNCVNPGTAETPGSIDCWQRADDPAAERAALEARQPHGRLVSRAARWLRRVAYLASPASGSTTGVTSRSTAACRTSGCVVPRLEDGMPSLIGLPG